MVGFKTGDVVRATKVVENHTITGAQPPVCGGIGWVVCEASTKGYYFVRFANNAHNGLPDPNRRGWYLTDHEIELLETSND